MDNAKAASETVNGDEERLVAALRAASDEQLHMELFRRFLRHDYGEVTVTFHAGQPLRVQTTQMRRMKSKSRR